jgi:predicted metalloprotease with PDZ domain
MKFIAIRPLGKAIIAMLMLAVYAVSWADLHYTVKPYPSSRTFGIHMEITNAKETETVRIPAWCPGFYFILDYDKSLSSVVVLDPDGNPLKFRWLNSRGFVIQNPNKTPITINYRILGKDEGLGFFRSHLRQDIGFINGPSAFLFADDHLTEPCSVTFNLPADWDIATAMETDGKGNYKAASYDEFVDHPIQLGKFTRRSFKVNNIPFEVIWVGDPGIRCNIEEETERLRRGSIPAMNLFGGASFKKYLYFIHLEVGDFNGGLEHRACNVIAVANTDTIHLDSLATHEYFHAWNVKQIRPQMLGPFDYTKEQRCSNIWFSEGVTEYYAQLHAYQAGFLSKSQFLEKLTNNIEELEMSKTAKTMTLEDACKAAWENGGFGVKDFSYYTKGLVVGLLSDAYIRGETKGKSSLNDLMRSFYAKYSLPNPGFSDDAIRDAIMEMSGEKYGPIYTSMVRTAQPMPYDILTKMGLRLTVPGEAYTEPLYLLSAEGRVTNATISNLEGGIRDGDKVLTAKIIGDSLIEVNVVRDDRNLKLSLPARKFRAGDYRLMANPFATAEEKQRLAEWLKIP